MRLGTTLSQTVGPYFAIGLPFADGPYVVPPDTRGVIRISGTVFDGSGDPVPDALPETWQADGDGRFADLRGHGGPSQLAGSRGFARIGSDDGAGRFELVTGKPGRVPGAGGSLQAPQIDVSVFACGLLHRCVTRIYFADEPAANAQDTILQSVPVAGRETLLALPGGGWLSIRHPDQGRARDPLLRHLSSSAASTPAARSLSR